MEVLSLLAFFILGLVAVSFIKPYDYREEKRNIDEELKEKYDR